MTRMPGVLLTITCALTFMRPAASGAQPQLTVERVSVSDAGAQLSGGGSAKTMSADGRFVLFRSNWPDVPGWHVRDRQLGTTTPLPFIWSSIDTAMSADGRYIATVQFQTEQRIEVVERATATLVWTNPWNGNGIRSISLSGTGDRVAFSGQYGGQIAAPFEHLSGWYVPGVYIHDGSEVAVRLVSIAIDGTPAHGEFAQPVISTDGRWIAFVSDSTNLVAGDVNGVADTFLLDVQTGAVTRLAAAAAPFDFDNPWSAARPAVSPNGRFIALVTEEPLSAADTNGLADIYVYDRQTGSFEWVSAAIPPPAGGQGLGYPAISGDGLVVAFVSSSALLGTRLYRHDRESGSTVDVAGVDRETVSLGADGRELAFTSWENQLVAGDTNEMTDAFVAIAAPCAPNSCGSPRPTVSVAGSSVFEGNGAASLTFTVFLSSPPSSPVIVHYATSDGTATQNADYLAAAGMLTFAAGETIKTIDVAILGDLLEEGDESVGMTLSSASGATIGTASDLGIIRDDDDQTPPVLIVPADLTRFTTDPGGAVVSFVVTATDNRDETPTVSCNPPSMSVFPVGTMTVTCTATDDAGNAVSRSFGVIMIFTDRTPPVLSLPANIDVTADSVEGRVVHFAVTATDNVDSDPFVTCHPPTGSFFFVGSSEVECRATDKAGNSRIGIFRVRVRPMMAELVIRIALADIVHGDERIWIVNDFNQQECDAVVHLQTCTMVVPAGTRLRLTLINGSRQRFSGWTGCDAMNGQDCALHILGNRTVEATLSRKPPQFDWTLSGGTIRWDGTRFLRGFGVSFGRTEDGRLFSGFANVVLMVPSEIFGTLLYNCGDFVRLERDGNLVRFTTDNGFTHFPFGGPPPRSGELSCIGHITDRTGRGERDDFSIQVFTRDGTLLFSWFGDADASAFELKTRGR